MCKCQLKTWNRTECYKNIKNILTLLITQQLLSYHSTVTVSEGKKGKKTLLIITELFLESAWNRMRLLYDESHNRMRNQLWELVWWYVHENIRFLKLNF